MRLVNWIDPNGYEHLSWVKDTAPPEAAPEGIPNDPPDINRLDWEAIKRSIHNALVGQRLITWADVQKQQNAIAGIVLAEVRKPIVALYQEKQEDGK